MSILQTFTTVYTLLALVPSSEADRDVFALPFEREGGGGGEGSSIKDGKRRHFAQRGVRLRLRGVGGRCIYVSSRSSTGHRRPGFGERGESAMSG